MSKQKVILAQKVDPEIVYMLEQIVKHYEGFVGEIAKIEKGAVLSLAIKDLYEKCFGENDVY